MKRKLLSLVLLAVSVALLAYNGYMLWQYLQEESLTDTLQTKLSILYTSGTDNDESSTVLTAEIVSESDISGDEVSEYVISAGLAALIEENSDCVGWLSIDGTEIDYPVMYRPEDKDYYLHRDFYGNYSSNGTLYISEICDPLESDNIIIYGHHMNSGKMFAALNEYKDQDFYEEHPTIVFETVTGYHVYEIVYVLTTQVYTNNDFAYYSVSDFEDEAAFDEYIEECSSRALYDTGKTASYGDKLLTLSTCEYSQSNGRMLVVARMVS